jgi:predicted RNase H-like nuclease
MTGRPHHAVLGVDGASSGWVGIRWDGAAVDALFATTLVALCAAAGSVDVVAVDMPIRLASSGPRRCDIEARPLLGARRSSLFAPPVVDALAMDGYAEANAWSKAATGHGISKQAWMLRPKIVEVRAADEAGDLPLHETFPELTFRAMNGDVPLSHAKRSWTGMATRLSLLHAAGIDVPADVGAAGAVAADDMIDAAGLAWSAMRIATGEARCVPADASPREPTIWW